MTSADTNGFTKFFKYVPLELREAIRYTYNMEYIRDAFVDGRITFNQGLIEDDDLLNIDIEEVIRNNWMNNDIVPSFNATEQYYDRVLGRVGWRSKVTGTYLSYKDVDSND